MLPLEKNGNLKYSPSLSTKAAVPAKFHTNSVRGDKKDPVKGFKAFTGSIYYRMSFISVEQPSAHRFANASDDHGSAVRSKAHPVDHSCFQLANLQRGPSNRVLFGLH
jgi:hypothetical protein